MPEAKDLLESMFLNQSSHHEILVPGELYFIGDTMVPNYILLLVLVFYIRNSILLGLTTKKSLLR